MADTQARDLSSPDTASLDVEDRFAIVPEWLLDADVSDAAVRLYAVLLRFGQTSGARMPARSTLAFRMRKKSTDTIDRAMRELVDLGAVMVQNRFDGGQRLTNKYLVRTTRPRPERESGGSRKNAATPTSAATPTVAATRSDAATRTESGSGSRISAARVAADLRHDPESFTHSSTPPPPTSASPEAESTPSASWAEEADRLIAECGISNWDHFVAECQTLRRQLGQPVARWSGHCLLAAIQLSVRNRGWSPSRAAAALRAVAADPTTRSPMRLAEAGPWWDEPAAATAVSDADVAELAAMEADLADAGGLRPLVQHQAREELAANGIPVTRATVTRRAYAMLQARMVGETGAAAC